MVRFQPHTEVVKPNTTVIVVAVEVDEPCSRHKPHSFGELDNTDLRKRATTTAISRAVVYKRPPVDTIAGVQPMGETPVLTAEKPLLGSKLAKVLAEFIGTFALVFAGCGAVVADHLTGGGVSHVGISLTFGLVVCVMIYATGHISGAHFNPAVTVAFASAGRFPWREVPAYALGQVAAAIAAIGLLSTFTGSTVLGETVPRLGTLPSLGVEAILTFFLMFVISAVATDHRAEGQMAGLAIGGTVAMCALFGGPLTGASMNPARSLGPALFGQGLQWMWLYTIGPMIGAVLAALTYRWLRCDDEVTTSDAAGCC